MAKYNRLRGLLAQTNLELARNIRIIDDVPTRTELIQYERRFVELYQQVREGWSIDACSAGSNESNASSL
jgi:hypothetical protein